MNNTIISSLIFLKCYKEKNNIIISALKIYSNTFKCITSENYYNTCLLNDGYFFVRNLRRCLHTITE